MAEQRNETQAFTDGSLAAGVIEGAFTEQRATLQVFYDGWEEYMDTVKAAIVPLTGEQLALRAAPHERSVVEIVRHIVEARVDWFHGFMGEDGEEIAPYVDWGAVSEDAPLPSAAELADGLDVSWRFMAERLARWTPEDMAFTFPIEWRGDPYNLSRSWVVWHILEHDMIHGGEVSLTLGMHGLSAPRP
ncbi:MAG TPA: DinB family protein [Chloroflexia bacterium]|jgi:uncharacterized damage-inducible protein DinB